MIPKQIRICWFSGKPLPPKYERYLNQVIDLHPGWSVDILMEGDILTLFKHRLGNPLCPLTPNYVKQAYAAKKWAFVSDYYRLLYMYQHGGITLDADVQVIKPLDVFLHHKFFSGMEIDYELYITATMGSIPGHKLIGDLLTIYHGENFSEMTNTKRITRYIHQHCAITNVRTTLDSKDMLIVGGKVDARFASPTDEELDFHLYPQEVFCPYDHPNRKATPTDVTYAIHHFGGSWKKR